MIDYSFDRGSDEFSTTIETNVSNNEDRLPKVFRIDYEITFRDNSNTKGFGRERKSCFIMGYSIEDCRERLYKSCGDSQVRIETEGKVCRVDGLTSKVVDTIFRVNGVKKPTPTPQQNKTMRKISSVENSNSIDLGSVKVNTTKTPIIDKDKGEKVDY